MALQPQPNVKALVAWGTILLLLGTLITAVSATVGSQFHSWLDAEAPRIVPRTPDGANPASDGQLVHVTGTFSPSNERVLDPETGVSGNGFALARVYEEYLYQSGDNGGQQEWVRLDLGVPDPSGPTTLWRTATWKPREVRLGALILSPELVSLLLEQATAAPPPAPRAPEHREVPSAERIHHQIIHSPQRLPIPASLAPRFRAQSDRRGMITSDGAFFWGKNPAAPAEGDRRISYRLVSFEEATISVLARQNGDRLEPHPCPPPQKSFCRVALGERDLASMLDDAHRAQGRSTARVVGCGSLVLTGGIVMLVVAYRAHRRVSLGALIPPGVSGP